MRGTRIAAIGFLFAVAGCGAAPLSNPTATEPEPTVPLLSDLDVPEDAPSVTLAEPAQARTGGFLANLLGGGAPSTPVDDAVEQALDETPVQQAEVAVAAAQPGLLGRVFNARAGGDVPTTAQPRNTIPPRTMMAFGEIGPTCGMSKRDLGTEIAKASGYTIYDTIPNSTAPRPHYITGFNDGCARQFTAALVLLGDVGTHELVRYSRTRVDLPYSETDNAYEAIKTSFCRTGFGKPCGTRLEWLAERTTFVTAYERFGAGPIWGEFLLHNGEVAAADIEGQ